MFEGSTFTPRSILRSVASPGIVMSGVRFTCSTMKILCGPSLPLPRGQPCFCGSSYPLCLYQASTRTTVGGATANLSAAPGFSGLNFANQPLPQVGRTGFAHDPPPRTVKHSSPLTQTSTQLIGSLLWPTRPARKTQRLVGGDGIEPPTLSV